MVQSRDVSLIKSLLYLMQKPKGAVVVFCGSILILQLAFLQQGSSSGLTMCDDDRVNDFSHILEENKVLFCRLLV